MGTSSTSQIERIFLDWKKPCLPQVADLIASRYERGRFIDAKELLVALPGARAGRRLLQLLVELGEIKGKVVIPPRIVTLGALPEALQPECMRFATSLESQLAWTETIRRAPPELLQRWIPMDSSIDGDGETREEPETLPLQRAQRIGLQCFELWREISSAALTFERVSELYDEQGYPEVQHWSVLAELYQEYSTVLDEWQLHDRYTQRLVLQTSEEISSPFQVMVVGGGDLNQSIAKVLERLRPAPLVVVHAPGDEASGFDTLGRLVPSYWIERELNLPEANLCFVDSAADQAEWVIEYLRAHARGMRRDQLLIALADTSADSYILERLREVGIAARVGEGTPYSLTPIGQLLSLLTRWLASGEFRDAASLIRHPDMQRWIKASRPDSPSSSEVLAHLDDYFERHLPRYFAPSDFEREEGSDLVQGALAIFAPLRSSPKMLSQWAQPLRECIISLFAPSAAMNDDDSYDHFVSEGLNALRSVLDTLELLPGGGVRCTASQALEIVLHELQAYPLHPAFDDTALELVGWLELAMDDASNVLLVGMNEGTVPESVNSDAFLPNTFRRVLGLVDNDRRLARDSYTVCAANASRSRVSGASLHCVAARVSTRGEALLPSRLLLKSDAQVVAKRIERFYGAESPRITRQASSSVSNGLLEVPPRPRPSAAVTTMSVTALRDYIRCPYRFYLRHVLRLEECSDHALELDALHFGSLAHDILSRFGRSAQADSTSAGEIESFLLSELKAQVASHFGECALPTVYLQISQLRERLCAFARWQAGWRAEGWQIRHVELGLQSDSAFHPSGIRVQGRIDRIDQHAVTGEWAIFDYKTGDSVTPPERAHRRASGDWIDLQLPAYQLMAQQRAVLSSARLGYISLSASLAKVGALFAEWSADDFESACQTIRTVLDRVSQQVYWPPAEILSHDSFATIVGTAQLVTAGDIDVSGEGGDYAV